MATTTHTNTEAAHGADHAAEAVGMPQLDFSSFPNQIFWLIVTLVAIYLVLSRVALPRIASVLAERQGTITKDIARAEELKQAAVDAEAAYNKALADARSEAQEIIAAAKADIQKELDAAVAVADAEISAKAAESKKSITAIRDSAMTSVTDVANDIAKDIVSAVSTAKIDAKSLKAAVSSRLKG